MKHELRLHSEPFNTILAGDKTVESRLYDEKRQKISIGDTLVFKSRENGDTITAIVTGLHKYPTFKELFQNIDSAKFRKKKLTENEFTHAMSQYYSLEEQESKGVVGIEFKL